MHLYTFRNENQFLPTDFRRRRRPERATATRSPSTSAFLDAGVDGIFSDNPDLLGLVAKRNGLA